MKTTTSLETAYFLSIENNWRTLDASNIFESDLSALGEHHIKLTQTVIDLLKKEHSEFNQHKLAKHLSIKGIIEDLENGKSSDGILILNDYDLIYLIGDLHSDDQSLDHILKATDFFNRLERKERFHMVFLGDYVDRGLNHLKTLEMLLTLKTMFPDTVHLLRGNHDGGILLPDDTIKLPYRIPENDDPMDYFPTYLQLLIRKNTSLSKEVLSAYFKLFDTLPYIAFLNTDLGVYECVHGGIPKPAEAPAEPFNHLKSLSALTTYPEHDNAGATILENLLWADPYRGEGDLKRHMKRFYFTEDDFYAYAKRFGIEKLFRGHEVVEDGLRSHFDGKLFTLFSSGKSTTTHYTWVNPAILEVSPSGAYKLKRLL